VRILFQLILETYTMRSRFLMPTALVAFGMSQSWLAANRSQTIVLAQEKAAPAAAEQSAYAIAVEAYIRFLPRDYSFGFEKLMTGLPEPLTRPGAPLNQVG
jgi:hypothetical protein